MNAGLTDSPFRDGNLKKDLILAHIEAENSSRR